MRPDHFTNTEQDAARYEAMRGMADDDRPTWAEAQRDEAEDVRDCDCCEQGKHATCRIEVWDDAVDDWAPCPCDLRRHS
jgi:hypothetical protein